MHDNIYFILFNGKINIMAEKSQRIKWYPQRIKWYPLGSFMDKYANMKGHMSYEKSMDCSCLSSIALFLSIVNQVSFDYQGSKQITGIIVIIIKK